MSTHTIPVWTQSQWTERLLALPRPGEEKIYAFYDHRVGAICTTPRLALMPLDDHMAHRGDGVFETMLYEHGRMYGLEEHIDRLINSAAPLGIELPCERSYLRDCMLACAAASGHSEGQVRVLLGRGPGGFGIDPRESPQPSLYIAAYAWSRKPDSWYAKGLTGFSSAIPAKQGYLATIKNTDYLPNVFMTREAHERGLDIAISFDEDGFVAEAAVASVALVDQNGVFRIPEFSRALAGTTVIRAGQLIEKERPVTYERLRKEDILNAAEFMTLGTGIGCAAIVSFDGEKIGDGRPGPIALRLRELLQQDILDTGVSINQ